MINKKILPLTELKLFIIDEIDEAFERGFLDIIKTITSLLSDTCQKVAYSSRLKISEDIAKLLKMKNPVKISTVNGDPILLLKNLR